ncbi:MAG: dTMP kinase [Beijerinckiaceae bacterium]
MNTASGRGRFITFEGGEGSGKSTQIRALADALQARGIAVTLTREPGGSPDAEKIRTFLLSGGGKDLGVLAETFLFSAARLDHVRTTIAPALKSGRWVLCDRFADSTRVYQGVAGAVDANTIRAIESVAIDGCKPDLTIILDVPAATGLARAQARRGEAARADRYEAESLAFHSRIRDAFRDLAQAEPGRCVLIDADRPADRVAGDVRRAVEARLREMLP